MEAQEARPSREFYDAIRSPVTIGRYKSRFGLFLNYLAQKGEIYGQQFRVYENSFPSKAKHNTNVEKSVVTDSMGYQEMRAGHSETSFSAVPNFHKPINVVLSSK